MPAEITLVRTLQKAFVIEGGKDTTSTLLSMAQTAGSRGPKSAGLDPDKTPPFYRPGKGLGYAILRGSWGRKKVELVWADHFMLHLGERKGREHQTGRTRGHFEAMLADAPAQGDKIELKIFEVEYIQPKHDDSPVAK